MCVRTVCTSIKTPRARSRTHNNTYSQILFYCIGNKFKLNFISINSEIVVCRRNCPSMSGLWLGTVCVCVASAHFNDTKCLKYIYMRLWMENVINFAIKYSPHAKEARINNFYSIYCSRCRTHIATYYDVAGLFFYTTLNQLQFDCFAHLDA